ncbi:proline-specific peptidase [Xylariaceae sp. FL1019]|nr:proline-specific peptidase [Xylariaceae sp. FL1019]
MASVSPAMSEGQVSFTVPGVEKPCHTWYKIIGEVGAVPALIILHGGPGCEHGYVAGLAALNTSIGAPIVLYDQVGCGRSTRFREKMGDAEFWSFDLFFTELNNLIDHLDLRKGSGFSILGHSWGGTLGGAYASTRPLGLRKLIIYGGPCDIPLYVKGVKQWMAQLPVDVRQTLEDCASRGDYESEEFEKAAAVWNAKHVCRLDPWPEELVKSFKNVKEDPTANVTIQGPAEFAVTGSIKNWSGWQEAHNIEAETLLLNGRYDEVQDIAMYPWFDAIPKVKWMTIEDASHLGHVENKERFFRICSDFLASD